MPRTRIKICGLTRDDDVGAAVASGADALGFVFYPPSPRYVSADAARALMAAVAKVALERGWVRVELFVEEGRPAIRFYESIGMRDLSHRHLRLEGEALQILAMEDGTART